MGSQTENERTVVSSDAIEADQTKEFENSETRDAVGRGEEGILEGVVIGNDEEVDVWDDAESDDEVSIGVNFALVFSTLILLQCHRMKVL